jgi:transcriptional regulator with XRE-family HTH domain
MRELQKRREQAGWSRAELARRSSINPSTISLIESGRLQPYDSQLVKLARALKIPVHSARSLLEEVDSRDSHPSR